jgi:uncharacterized damage-inducible protein DinB
MTLTDFFVSQLEFEAAPTRKMLERVPMERPDWKPHDKSTALGRLATHVAELPSWITVTIKQNELDVAPVGGPAYTPTKLTTTGELLAALERNVEEARRALQETNDAHLDEPWTLLAGGHTVFSWPRRTVLQHTVFNHLAHHRAQLGVYLRLNGIPLPAIYGPSADEQ